MVYFRFRLCWRAKIWGVERQQPRSQGRPYQVSRSSTASYHWQIHGTREKKWERETFRTRYFEVANFSLNYPEFWIVRNKGIGKVAYRAGGKFLSCLADCCYTPQDIMNGMGSWIQPLSLITSENVKVKVAFPGKLVFMWWFLCKSFNQNKNTKQHYKLQAKLCWTEVHSNF